MGNCLNFSLDLCEKDATRRDGATNEHKDFGNIKTLIDKEWCQKHHYIHMEKDENSDPDQPHFVRAHHMFSRILNFYLYLIFFLIKITFRGHP